MNSALLHVFYVVGDYKFTDSEFYTNTILWWKCIIYSYI